MKYLCLIYLNEEEMTSMPAQQMDGLNRGHLDLNDELRRSAKLVEAEALQPSGRTVRLRRGKRIKYTDGPFTEAKELIAGFYVLEASDIEEAAEIAARFPGGRHGTVDIHPCRELIVADR
jgi:hypothetical protein